MTTDARAAMQQLEQKFVDWAERRPDIRAAVVVGSWARVDDHPADEWSDLDIGFLTTRSRQYLRTTAWLREIGNVWLAYPDRLGPNLHVLFEGAIKVDILPLPMRTMKFAMRIIPLLMRHESLLRFLPEGARRDLDYLRDFYRRGIRIILDKDGFAASFLAVLAEAFPDSTKRHERPTEREFLNTLSDFWTGVVTAAKHMRRGELFRVNSTLKEELLQMIEWHAWATHDLYFDTWREGQHLEEWADPRVVKQLQEAFSRYDEEDMRRSLLATVDLFRWLAQETAQKWNYAYPSVAEQHVSAWATNCLSERTSTTDTS